MTWFKVDDGLWGHPKWLATPLPARGLWVTAGSWSAANLTDGQVPRHVLPSLGGKPRDAAALVDVGLWVATDGGWRFHEWNEPGRQPTKAAVLAEREAAAERQRRAREKAAEKKSQSESRRDTAVSHGPPVPSRPVPVPTNPSLITLVCRRLFGDARTSMSDDDRAEMWGLWAETAGPSVDLDAELRRWLIHNTATDLRNPGSALLGWLQIAAKHASIPALPGCDRCVRGWLPDEFGQPSASRCVACRSHLQAVGAS